MLHVSYFFVFRLLHTPALDSFPTRRSSDLIFLQAELEDGDGRAREHQHARGDDEIDTNRFGREQDRESTRLNSSHLVNSYAVFCLKKKRKLPLQQLCILDCYTDR